VLSTVPSPLGGLTLLGGTITPSDLLAPLSVLLGQTSTPLEHLSRSHEHRE
jgi:hypothetical protein